jgi:(1->4)-alpha-D-glucan 1-alpha-D-glucosylmutase
LTAKLLHYRREQPELFANGAYQPLQVEGERKEHVFAFARTYESKTCVLIVPRWTARLMEGAAELPRGERVWLDTRVNVGELATPRELLSGRQLETQRTDESNWVRAADAFAEFPAALLISEKS